MIRSRQRGAALIIALVLLAMMTLMTVTSFNLSQSNLLSVGNFQFRNEAVASANAAIEERLSSTFGTLPVATTSAVDINNDDVTDYTVTITPVCIRATLAGSAAPSSLTLPALSAGSTWHTFWDITADINDANTGTALEVHAGVRVLLSGTEKDAACP